jgi:protein-L-isoaspartate O-methyltransferase
LHVSPRVLAGVEGKDVLCLASGGGHQSAVFSLLGARVAVVDLAEGQLEADRKAAAHYGYEVATFHADMRDLSCLSGPSFGLVYQENSISCVPDVRQVYCEVARSVLKKCSLIPRDGRRTSKRLS